MVRLAEFAAIEYTYSIGRVSVEKFSESLRLVGPGQVGS